MAVSKKVHAIINPFSGHGKAGRNWPQILACLQAQGFDVTWRQTEGPWHAAAIAREFARAGARLIISVGGEGVMNEILNGLFAYREEAGTMPVLAMIPVGTGTDLSRTLRIPKDHCQAIDVIRQGRVKLIDAGRMVFHRGGQTWTRYFVNGADAGLGGAVARVANTIPKVLGGFLTFLLSSLVALFTFRRLKLRIWIDGRCVDHGLMSIVGALNGQYFGGGMHAAPMAVLDDGTMEFLYVKDTNLFKFVVHVLARVYTGEHLGYRNVHLRTGRRLKVEGERVFLAEVDGEVERADMVEVDLLPAAVRIVAAR